MDSHNLTEVSSSYRYIESAPSMRLWQPDLAIGRREGVDSNASGLGEGGDSNASDREEGRHFAYLGRNSIPMVVISSWISAPSR